MNKPQRITLFLAAGLVAAMVLYSPRTHTVYGGHEVFSGYYFILDSWHFREPIDFPVLIGQAVMVLIITGLLVLAFKSPYSN
jgi:hypothetical protein